MQNPPFHSEDEHIAGLLSAYIDSRLTPVERLRVDAHLPHCPSCRSKLASLQATVALLHELTVMPVPRPFYVYAPESATARPVGVLQRLLSPGWAYGFLRAATTAVAVLLVAVVAVDALGPTTFRAAAPAPAAYRGAAQSEVSPPPGTAMNRTGTQATRAPEKATSVPGEAPVPQAAGRTTLAPTIASAAGAPTEQPKAAAPLTTFSLPTEPPLPGAAQATPAPQAPTVAPGTTAPVGLGAGPPSLPPTASVQIGPAPMAANQTDAAASPTPGGSLLAPKAAGTPSLGAGALGETPVAQPSASTTPGKLLTATLAVTATRQAEPRQTSPASTLTPAPRALLASPAAPPPGLQGDAARPTAILDSTGAASPVSEPTGISPIRLGEIGLGAIVFILLALTLYARRGQKPPMRG